MCVCSFGGGMDRKSGESIAFQFGLLWGQGDEEKNTTKPDDFQLLMCQTKPEGVATQTHDDFILMVKQFYYW